MLTLYGSPKEIGYQFGVAIRDKTLLLLEHLEQTVSVDEKHRNGCIRFYEQYFPQMLEEIEGISEAIGVSFHRALILQIYWDVHTIFGGECTSYAVFPSFAKGRFLCGINKDVSLLSKNNLVLVKMCPTHGPQKIMAAYPGSLAGPGMNEFGVCFFGNSLYGPSKGPHALMPVMQRIILESCTANDALIRLLKILDAGYTGGSGHYLVTDASNTAIGLEVLRDRRQVLYGDSAHGCYVHSNHVISGDPEMLELEESERSGNTIGRRERLIDLLNQYAGKIDETTMKMILSDHSQGAFSICRHQATNMMGITSETGVSLICIPKEKRILVSMGNPCSVPYEEYSFDPTI